MIDIQPKGEESVDNKLEILKDLTKVHNQRMKNILSSDYILAKYDEQQREAIPKYIKSLHYGYLIKTHIALNCKKFMQEKINYKKEEVKPYEEFVKRTRDADFDSGMILPNVKSVLHRNQKENWIIERITEAEIQKEEEGMNLSGMEKIKEALTRRGDGEPIQ